jgi:hypothetical protein
MTTHSNYASHRMKSIAAVFVAACALMDFVSVCCQQTNNLDQLGFSKNTFLQ